MKLFGNLLGDGEEVMAKGIVIHYVGWQGAKGSNFGLVNDLSFKKRLPINEIGISSVR